jgi:hypothetical protein
MFWKTRWPLGDWGPYSLNRSMLQWPVVWFSSAMNTELGLHAEAHFSEIIASPNWTLKACLPWQRACVYNEVLGMKWDGSPPCPAYLISVWGFYRYLFIYLFSFGFRKKLIAPSGGPVFTQSVWGPLWVGLPRTWVPPTHPPTLLEGMRPTTTTTTATTTGLT